MDRPAEPIQGLAKSIHGRRRYSCSLKPGPHAPATSSLSLSWSGLEPLDGAAHGWIWGAATGRTSGPGKQALSDASVARLPRRAAHAAAARRVESSSPPLDLGRHRRDQILEPPGRRSPRSRRPSIASVARRRDPGPTSVAGRRELGIANVTRRRESGPASTVGRTSRLLPLLWRRDEWGSQLLAVAPHPAHHDCRTEGDEGGRRREPGPLEREEGRQIPLEREEGHRSRGRRAWRGGAMREKGTIHLRRWR